MSKLNSVEDPRLSALVKATNSVPREEALATPNHPECEPALSFLRCSVNGIGKAQRARIKLMNNCIGHVVLHHRNVHTIFDVLPAEGKLAGSRA